ncbi:unnamed protein product [Brassica oleracea var. botrytis]
MFAALSGEADIPIPINIHTKKHVDFDYLKSSSMFSVRPLLQSRCVRA